MKIFALKRCFKGIHIFVLTVISCLVILPLHAETISGTVVGPDGKPITAKVYYVPSWGNNSSAKEVQTSEDGSFQLEVLPSKELIEKTTEKLSLFSGGLAAYVSGYSLGLVPLKQLNANVIKLSPTRKLRGLLKDENGTPASGAKIRVRMFIRDEARSQRSSFMFVEPPMPLQAQFITQTDEKGNWELDGVPPAVTTIIMLDDDRFLDASIQFDAEGETPAMLYTLRQLTATTAGSIEGKVVGVDGKPVANVAIFAKPQPNQTKTKQVSQSAFARSGADGIFRIKRVNPGTYNLFITNRGSETLLSGVGGSKSQSVTDHAAAAIENVKVTAAETSKVIPLQLVKSSILKGRVLDRQTGEPLAGVSVGVYGKGSPRTIGAQRLAVTDSDGRYELTVVPGANALFASDTSNWDKNANFPTTPVTVAAGQTKAVSLWIDRTIGNLKGLVVDEAGKPVNGVELNILNPSNLGQSVVCDANGAFEASRMQFGILNVGIHDPRWSLLQPKSLNFSASQKTPVKIVVRVNPVAKVTGRVVDSAGNPIDSVKVGFEVPFGEKGHRGRRFFTAFSDAEGRYSVEALSMPDALKLNISSATKTGFVVSSKAKVPSTANAESREIELTDLVLTGLQKTFRGKVLSKGTPVADAIVRSSGDGYDATAITDAEGNFTLNDQPEGKATLMAAQGNRYGRAEANGDITTISLDGEAKVSTQDVKRAIQIFREMAPYSGVFTIQDAVNALIPHDPAVAFELLTTFAKVDADTARTNIIGCLSSRSSEAVLQWAQGELPKMTDHGQYIVASTTLGLLLASQQTEVVESLYDTALSRLSEIPLANALDYKARLAALATRLQLPEADGMATEVIEEARPKNSLNSLVVPFANGSNELALKILDQLPVVAESNIISHRQAIEVLAKYDIESASRLLEKMRLMVDEIPETPSNDGVIRGRDAMEFEWAFAGKAVMRFLDRSDAATAQSIARRVMGYHRVSALAMAAEFGTKQQRVEMAQETIAAENRGPWLRGLTMTRMAALIAQFDKEKARSTFKQAVDEAKSERKIHSDSYSTDWGFYAAFWEPAEARLMLESEWLRFQIALAASSDEDKEQNANWRMASFAKAMASVDFERALEWAQLTSNKSENPQHSSPRAGVLLILGQLLLLEPEKRRLMTTSPETGFDS